MKNLFGIPQEFFKKIRAQAEQEYPKECCGVLLGLQSDPSKYTRLWPCKNAQDEAHALDPKQFPRTSRNAYFLDPKELFAIQKEMRQRREEIRLIYHSHIEAPAVFSEEDKRCALADDEPVYPGVDYLIFSVLAGKVKEAVLYRWHAPSRQYKRLEN